MELTRLKNLYEYLKFCDRCSKCKFVNLERITSWRFSYGCPAVARYNFHIYASGGKLDMALALCDGRINELNDNVVDIIYRCLMCASCDVSCKYTKDSEPFEVIQQLRITCVENGYLHPAIMPLIDWLRKEDNMMYASKADRGKWAEGLDIKDINREKAKVYFHAGCRYSFDEGLWPAARSAVNLLKKANVDVAIAGKEEICCGGRAYDMGYEGELTKYAESNFDMLKRARVETVVTPCADCYYAFKVLYDKIGRKLPMEVLHITEYLNRLVGEGRLKPAKKIPMKVTYHDPCHLGRKGEPYIHWTGVIKHSLKEASEHVPPKEIRRGTYGIYEPPRDILKAIPGLRLAEMERIKEYAWCCGSGGGAKDTNPEFAIWTANERIAEAESTGAEAIVTACPWCKRNFLDATGQSGSKLKVYDIVELLEAAI
jgi:Fe-S oxidoreductase